MNKITLIGRLTKEPEIRSTQDGVKVATFDMAVNRRFDKKTADFFRVAAWRALGETCAKYLVKGQMAAVTGELQSQTYTDKEGVRRKTFQVVADEVEFLTKPQGGSANMLDLAEDEDLPF